MALGFIYVSYAIIFCCMMTSLAMTSDKFSKMISSSGAQVCSNDSSTSPYHVFPLFSGGEMRCGIECLVSSLCWYYQFKTSTELDQCELYNKLPVNVTERDDCVGFVKSVPGGCLEGWIKRSKGCYQLAIGQFSNWNKADEFCSALRTPQLSHLVNVESLDKQQLVAGLVLELIGLPDESEIPPTSSVNLALRQLTWQSSTHLTFTSARAVDGNKDTVWLNGYCSATDIDASPWLAVDLGEPADVYGAAVTNREDVEMREDNFIVGLTQNPPNTMPPTTNGYITCGQWPGSAPTSATMFVRCVDNLPPARYVVIIQQYQPLGHLQICELEVYQNGVFTRHSVNLALNRPTWQSSNYSYPGLSTRFAWYAVDGNNRTDLVWCACTAVGDTSPWLAVDLGSMTYVYGVALTNRDSSESREDNFLVGLTNNPPNTMSPTTNSYTTCGQWPGSAPTSATMFVRCFDNLPPARYVVIIQQYLPLGHLQICELEVYQRGVFTRHSVNLALNRPTWQSSIYGTSYSWYAVDGNNRTDLDWCACTAGGDTSPWWAVDLGSMTYVYGVALTNRDSSDNFLVGLTNNPPSTMPPTTNGYTTCGQWPGPALASATMFVRCVDNLPPARYVVIIQQYQPRGHLQICELEVYGKAFIWLNGRLVSATSPFEWSPYSNSPMQLTFTNWAYGMPDTAVNSSCLAMDVVNGTWYDMQCNNPGGAVVYAICETP